MMFSVLAMLAAVASDPASTSSADDKDPMVCKRTLVGSTGSRLRSKKQCLRASVWDEIQRHGERAAREITEKGGSVGDKPPTPKFEVR